MLPVAFLLLRGCRLFAAEASAGADEEGGFSARCCVESSLVQPSIKSIFEQFELLFQNPAIRPPLSGVKHLQPSGKSLDEALDANRGLLLGKESQQ